MAFTFGFSGDDIDTQGVNGGPAMPKQANGGHNAIAEEDVPRVNVEPHDLRQLLSSLPDRLSYSTVRIESPTGRVLHLPRRELYDVRVQLMSEDEASNEETLKDIGKSDIRTGIYEGGFKTWECSVDLASLLLDRGPRKDIDELIRCDQLGAGTALPTLVLFRHALQHNFPVTFTLSDYNENVLRLVTLPNVVLAWAAYSENPLIDVSTETKGDLDLSPAVLESFTKELASAGIQLNFLSGPWSPDLASLIPHSAPDMGTLILGAETIYSPASTEAFVELLITLLKRVKMAKAMIGAKRIYFGVGGSIDGLKAACRDQGAVCYEIENHGVPGMESAGVGRALVEVQMY